MVQQNGTVFPAPRAPKFVILDPEKAVNPRARAITTIVRIRVITEIVEIETAPASTFRFPGSERKMFANSESRIRRGQGFATRPGIPDGYMSMAKASPNHMAHTDGWVPEGLGYR